MKSPIKILWKRQSNMGQNELGRKRKHSQAVEQAPSACYKWYDWVRMQSIGNAAFVCEYGVCPGYHR